MVSVSKRSFLKTSRVPTDYSLSVVHRAGFVYKHSLRFPHVALNNSLSVVLSSAEPSREENQTISKVPIAAQF